MIIGQILFRSDCIAVNLETCMCFETTSFTWTDHDAKRKE